MIGYHYTPLRNWQSIMKMGYMQPCWSTQKSIDDLFDKPMLGTYVWEYLLSPEEELAMLVFILGRHNSTEITKLAISYELDDILQLDNGKKNQFVSVTDLISCGEYSPMIETQPAARFLVGQIPIERIKCAKTFNMLDII